jgi:3-hydroxyisobutyrate dehydrogenase-like beta-hydroxyacid dehydrogenase
MGAIGTATYIKIATNLIAGVQIQVLAEALEFLNLGKIPLHYLHEALQYNAAFSTTIGMKLPLMLQGDFEPHFSTKNMLKDLQLALDLVENDGISLPATAATAASLK